MGLMSISIDGASDATRWTFKQYKSPLSCSRDSWGETLELPLTPHEEQRRQWLHRTLNLMGGRSRTRHAWRTAREDNGRTRDVLLKARREKQKVRHKVTSFFEVKKKNPVLRSEKKKNPVIGIAVVLPKIFFENWQQKHSIEKASSFPN